MAKIIHIGNGAGLRQIVADLQKMVDSGEVVTLAAAVKLTDRCVATAYHADYGERMELIGHLQADMALQAVSANLE